MGGKEKETKEHVSLQVRKESGFGGYKGVNQSPYINRSINEPVALRLSEISLFRALELCGENQRYRAGDDGRIEIL